MASVKDGHLTQCSGRNALSRSATMSFAIVALLNFLTGCASTTGPEANADLTVERILTEPLTGIAGMSRVKRDLSEVYGFDPSVDQYTNRDSKLLAGGWVLSQLWIEPSPADFISVSLATQPCFPVQRALGLTQATPYQGSGELSAPMHNAIKNGMLVGLTSSPDGKCLRTIHIERDK